MSMQVSIPSCSQQNSSTPTHSSSPLQPLLSQQAMAFVGPIIACASKTLPVAIPSASGDLIPTLPSSDCMNSRILLAKVCFHLVLSFLPVLCSGGIEFPTQVRWENHFQGELFRYGSRAFPLEMLENIFNFGRCMLFGQHFYQSSFKV